MMRVMRVMRGMRGRIVLGNMLYLLEAEYNSRIGIYEFANYTLDDDWMDGWTMGKLGKWSKKLLWWIVSVLTAKVVHFVLESPFPYLCSFKRDCNSFVFE